jgi:hypothetical protein
MGLTDGSILRPRLLAVSAAFAVVPISAALVLGPHSAAHPLAMWPDREVYVAIARSPFADAPAVHHPPFCWRILPSLLVWASGLQPELGFRVLTLASLALLPAATIAWLIALGISPVSASGMGAIAALAAPMLGYAVTSLPMIDAFALLLVTIGAWAVAARRGAVFVVCLTALALTKETWILLAAFAVAWTWAHDRRFFRIAAPAIAGALCAWLALRVLIPASETYSLHDQIVQLYWPPDLRTILRRLLLATGATWNVLLPFATLTVVRLRCQAATHALAIPVALATTQILIASDTPRPVAAAYPFVLALCATELDRWPRRARVGISICLALAQLPWLLTYAWVVRLPLRGVEIAIVLISLVLVPIVRRERTNPTCAT